jgi:hypothetical protein
MKIYLDTSVISMLDDSFTGDGHPGIFQFCETVKM